MIPFCDRCGKDTLVLNKFCDGKYYFCQVCSQAWIDLLRASNDTGAWNSALFDWWLKNSPLYNPSKRFAK